MKMRIDEIYGSASAGATRKRALPKIVLLALLAAFALPAVFPARSAARCTQPDTIPADSIDGVYIPLDEDDFCAQLDKILTDELKAEILTMSLSEFNAEAHFGLGMWVRNAFGLWKDSRLAVYLQEKRGLEDPDDMSSHLLTVYYKHLNEKN